ETVISAVVGFANSGVNANLSSDARHDELGNSSVLQNRVQIRRKERSFPRLINDRLRRKRIEFGNDVVPRLATNENAAHRTVVADLCFASTANLFCGRQIAEVRTVSLARVNYRKFSIAPRSEQFLVRANRAPQLRNIVAEHFAEP